MSTRTVIGVVGAVIGGIVTGGSPAGFQWGWALGSAVGGAVDPQIIRGPSIGDIASQTSEEGIPRPIVFGLSQPMAGNIIASGEPRIVRRRERQGKGGPKVETESVYRTYAIGICEGPITRVVRVWRNGTLVYDVLTADDDLLEELENFELTSIGSTLHFAFLAMRSRMSGNNLAWMGNARYFLGNWDQLPSSDLEAQFGVGATPAHRGTAYMVMADEDLTDLRGAIPQYQFQVERCEGEFYTSRPYPVNDIAPLSSGALIDRQDLRPPATELLESRGHIESITMPVVLLSEDAGIDAVESSGEVLSVSLTDGAPTIITHEEEPEALERQAVAVAGFSTALGNMQLVIAERTNRVDGFRVVRCGHIVAPPLSDDPIPDSPESIRQIAVRQVAQTRETIPGCPIGGTLVLADISRDSMHIERTPLP